MAVRAEPVKHSYTYHTPVPAECANGEPCLLGVDEAGRGPVLGPMVYGICYCPLTHLDSLKQLGFAGKIAEYSKTLNEPARERLLSVLCDNNAYIGWSVRVLSPQDISQSMLRRNKYNLNTLSHDTTIQLIRDVLQAGVNVAEIYIDTVGPPESYQAMLSRLFPDIRITVAKKADSLYPIVSAASICAKVTRDRVLRNWQFAEPGASQLVSTEFGSGYSGDPNTVKWLNGNIDRVFGFPGLVRFSWSTCERLLDNKAAAMHWHDEDAAQAQPMPSSVCISPATTLPAAQRAPIFQRLGLKSSRCL